MSALQTAVETALRETLTRYDAVIVLDPSKGYHYGSGPSVAFVAQGMTERLRALLDTGAAGAGKVDMSVLADVPHDHSDGACTACLRDGYLRSVTHPDPGEPRELVKWPCGKTDCAWRDAAIDHYHRATPTPDPGAEGERR